LTSDESEKNGLATWWCATSSASYVDAFDAEPSPEPQQIH
jgi:hypothetical protein